MKMKKWLALMLAGILVLSLLAGCSGNSKPDDADEPTEPASDAADVDETTDDVDAEEPTDEEPEASQSTDPAETILKGRYTYAFSAEGYGDFVSFFHFYPEDPVLGAVFYVGYLNNQTTFTGTYEVIEEERSYTAAPSRDDPVEDGSAPYTIVFYDWSGNEIDRCAFDGEIIYNDLKVVTGYGGNDEFYYHDADMTDARFTDAYAMEVGVAYLDFIVDGDEYSGVTLNHNMTYVDLTGSIVEGTWSVEANAEGGYDYTLTPDDPSDTGAVVSVAADAMTATYTADGSDESINLVAVGGGVTVIGQYDGTCEAYGAECPLSLVLYDDGTCELIADVFGNVGPVDNGTYEAVETGCLLHMEKAGDLEAALTVHYVGTNDLGEVDAELTLVETAGSAEPELVVIAQYDGTCEAYGTECPLSLVLYDNGTCELTADVYGNVGVVDSGTYEAVEAGCLLHMEKAGDIEAALTAHYVGTNDIGDVDAELTLVQ